MAILFGCMEKLLKRKKCLRINLNSHALTEDNQHLSQGISGKSSSDINIFGLRSTYDKANNQISSKVEIKTPSESYKVRQVREQERYPNQCNFLELKANG